MCDYSLMAVNNRLAVSGEELVVYRFSSGTIGLASPAEIQVACELQPPPPKGLWAKLLVFLEPRERSLVPAVCVPPGALLLLRDIPVSLRQELGVACIEEVRFTQVTADANSYRDSVYFYNGMCVSLQRLREGQRVRILDLSGAEASEPYLERHSRVA